MRDLELIKEEVRNSEDCVVSKADIEEYREAGCDVRFVATVDIRNGNLADAACIKFTGTRQYDEYCVDGYTMYAE